MTLSNNQLQVLLHTLGLNEHQNQSRRNRFVTGQAGRDYEDLLVLQGLGLMASRNAPGFCAEGDVVFYATEEGQAFAMANLPAPRPPQKRTRYEDFRYADICHTFGEYLAGGRLPQMETQYGYPKNRYRMYRTVPGSYGQERDVVGEWATTHKEAKASYKRALAALRGRKVEKKYQLAAA